MPDSAHSRLEVAYSNDVLTPYSGDAARYEINPQSGVLTVFDGDGQRFHFSPAGWDSDDTGAPSRSLQATPERLNCSRGPSDTAHHLRKGWRVCRTGHQ